MALECKTHILHRHSPFPRGRGGYKCVDIIDRTAACGGTFGNGQVSPANDGWRLVASDA